MGLFLGLVGLAIAVNLMDSITYLSESQKRNALKWACQLFIALDSVHRRITFTAGRQLVK